ARVDLALLDVHRTAAVVDDVDGDVAAHRAVPGRRPRRAGGRGQGENGIIGRWLHRLAVTAWLWRRGPGRPPQVSRPEARSQSDRMSQGRPGTVAGAAPRRVSAGGQGPVEAARRAQEDPGEQAGGGGGRPEHEETERVA